MKTRVVKLMPVNKKMYVPSKRVKIVETINEYYSTDIFANTRKREICFPRQIAMVMLRKFGYMGVVDVGKLFKRDHSCVSHARKTVLALYDSDPEIKRQIIELETFFK